MLRNLVAVFFWLSAIIIFIASIGADVSQEWEVLQAKRTKAEVIRAVPHRK